jgi:hypothetical protein
MAVIQAAVARDPVEPRLHVQRPIIGDHRVIGGGQHVLQHILSVLARAEQVTAE